MAKRNNAQNSRLHKLIGMLRISKEQKEELVYTYTDGRSGSSADLTEGECNLLLMFLQDMYNKKQNHFDERAVAMRRKFFATARDHGWVVNDKPDYKRINGWLLKFGYLHKGINEYTYQELPTLLTQFEKVGRA